MARPALDIMQDYITENGDADLVYVLESSKVAVEQQYDLIHGNYSSLRAFSGMDDSRPLVRAALVTDLGLDPTAQGPAGPAARVALAALVGAWEVARDQVATEVKMRAESKVLRITRPVSVQDKNAMKRAVELRFGKIPNREMPSSDYVSQKLEEMEGNDPVASPLDEVTSQLDVETDNITANIDLTGKVQILRKRAKSSLPATPEQFRLKIRVERNLWLFLASKFTNKPWLRGLAPAHWDQWTDFFLGEKVMLMSIPTPEGAKVPLHPPWQIVLSFEFECRKRVMELINEDGLTMVEAMTRVPRDGELKEIAFTSPIALMSRGAVKRVNDPEADGAALSNRARKRLTKGGGKGNPGKGKGNQDRGGGGGAKAKGKGKGKLLSKTPDGRRICYAYNNQGCTKGEECEFAHICQRQSCLGPHSKQDCPGLTSV